MGFLSINIFPASCNNRQTPYYWSSSGFMKFSASWEIGYTQTITPLTPY